MKWYPRGWSAMVATLMVATLMVALGGLVGCVKSRPLNGPPADTRTRPWFNTNSAEQYTNPVERTVAGLAAAFSSEPATVPAAPGKPLQVLVLTGGGKYGAFTAGVLNGWTAAGTRPRFDVVTGISSGAISAVYAYLGPQYDPKLAYYFTQLEKRDLYRVQPIRGPLFKGALASDAPLKEVIDREVSAQLVTEMAQAHRDGRRLFIATHNVSTRRVVIWDIGAIACSGRPDAADLIRRVIRAATSIPSWTAPVEFDVVVNGCRYQELHADAGNMSQGFVQTAHGLPPGSDVWVACAGKLYREPLDHRARLIENVSEAVSDALYALFRSNMLNIYALCATSRSRFHLIAVPAEVRVQPGSLSFNRDDLRALYDVGYQMSASGQPWRTTPPDVLPGERTMPRTGTEFVVP